MFVLIIFTIVGFIDMGHYARLMWFPLIDVFVLLIGLTNRLKINGVIDE